MITASVTEDYIDAVDFTVLDGQKLINGKESGNHTMDSAGACTLLCLNLGMVDCVSVNFNKETKICQTNTMTVVDNSNIEIVEGDNWIYLGPNPAIGSPHKVIGVTLVPGPWNITVQWISGYDGGYSQTFTVEYKMSSDNSWSLGGANISDPGTGMNVTFILPSITEATSYDVRINSTNTRPVLINTVSVEDTTTTLYPSTCLAWKEGGYTNNGAYTIDPDGSGTLAPYSVTCDFSGSAVLTTLTHNRNTRTHESGHEGCFEYALTYTSASLAQVSAMIDANAHCHQYLKWECYGASGVGGCVHWKDRSGNKMTYWGWGNSASICACKRNGNTCNGARTCNCQTNDNAWRVDGGIINDKTKLPVSKLSVGDTGDASEQAYYTISNLVCSSVNFATPKSCTDYKIMGYTASDIYFIDPDGSGGQNEFAVTCDMTTNPPTTMVSHNRESRTTVSGYEAQGSFSHAVTYQNGATISIAQINGLTSISANCTQYIKYECQHSILTAYGWWLDKSGTKREYWGGGNEATGGCKCYTTTSCATTSKKCNCDINDTALRFDEGDLTNKAQLPVTQLQFGDTGGTGEAGYYTLGKLKCQV